MVLEIRNGLLPLHFSKFSCLLQEQIGAAGLDYQQANCNGRHIVRGCISFRHLCNSSIPGIANLAELVLVYACVLKIREGRFLLFMNFGKPEVAIALI